MQKYPKTSLVISTYNWPEALNLCLKSVKEQRILPDEVVIADDGSTDTTRLLIEEYQKNFPVPLIHVWQEDEGYRKTRIVNKAVKQTSSDYLIFTDGDIVLHPLFVADHLNDIHPDYFLQGSRGMLTYAKTASMVRTGDIHLTPFSKGLKNRLNVIRCKVLSYLIYVSPTSPKHIIGCNYSFWKKDYIAANGLNNDFDHSWGHDDSEYAARLINNGVKRKKIKFQAICYHLYHPFHPRDKEQNHWLVFEQTVAQKIKRCKNGYDQV